MASPDQILEITHLNVVPHTGPFHPSILQNLQQARTLLADKVHPTRSHFYQDLQAPEKIFILGTWPSVEKHQKFLGNTQLKADILGHQEESMSFGWSAHLSLCPPWLTMGGIGQAIESSKVVGIQRMRIAVENAESFLNTLGDDFRHSLQRASNNEVLVTWNLDFEEKRIKECMILTLWLRGSDEDRERIYRGCLENLGNEYKEYMIGDDLRFVKDMEAPEERQNELLI